jgi:hypothetical protein
MAVTRIEAVIDEALKRAVEERAEVMARLLDSLDDDAPTDAARRR